MDRNYVYFQQNMPNLYEKYGSTFVIVKDETIVGNYETFQEAINAAIKQYKPGSFIVQQCAQREEDLVAYFISNVS